MSTLSTNIAIALAIAILIGGAWLLHISQDRPVSGQLENVQLSIARSLCSPSVDICELPLEKMLQFPGAFNGKTVRTEGVLRLEFEGNSLYVDKPGNADREHRRSIWVSVNADQYDSLNGESVVVEGRFRGGKQSNEQLGGYGHMGLWYGEIEITSIEPKANKVVQQAPDPANLLSGSRSPPISAACAFTRDMDVQLTDGDLCAIAKLQERCEGLDECFVECFLTGYAVNIGGGCDHMCNYGGKVYWRFPPGTNDCYAKSKKSYLPSRR